MPIILIIEIIAGIGIGIGYKLVYRKLFLKIFPLYEIKSDKDGQQANIKYCAGKPGTSELVNTGVSSTPITSEPTITPTDSGILMSTPTDSTPQSITLLFRYKALR